MVGFQAAEPSREQHQDYVGDSCMFATQVTAEMQHQPGCQGAKVWSRLWGTAGTAGSTLRCEGPHAPLLAFPHSIQDSPLAAASRPSLAVAAAAAGHLADAPYGMNATCKYVPHNARNLTKGGGGSVWASEAHSVETLQLLYGTGSCMQP